MIKEAAKRTRDADEQARTDAAASHAKALAEITKKKKEAQKDHDQQNERKRDRLQAELLQLVKQTSAQEEAIKQHAVQWAIIETAADNDKNTLMKEIAELERQATAIHKHRDAANERNIHEANARARQRHTERKQEEARAKKHTDELAAREANVTARENQLRAAEKRRDDEYRLHREIEGLRAVAAATGRYHNARKCPAPRRRAQSPRTRPYEQTQQDSSYRQTPRRQRPAADPTGQPVAQDSRHSAPPPRQRHPRDTPCRYFNTSRGCHQDSHCQFRHDPPQPANEDHNPYDPANPTQESTSDHDETYEDAVEYEELSDSDQEYEDDNSADAPPPRAHTIRDNKATMTPISEEEEEEADEDVQPNYGYPEAYRQAVDVDGYMGTWAGEEEEDAREEQERDMDPEHTPRRDHQQKQGKRRTPRVVRRHDIQQLALRQGRRSAPAQSPQHDQHYDDMQHPTQPRGKRSAPMQPAHHQHSPSQRRRHAIVKKQPPHATQH